MVFSYLTLSNKNVSVTKFIALRIVLEPVPSTDLSQNYWQEVKLFIKIPRKNNAGQVAVIVRQETEARLSGTCFRGPDKNLAGNISMWHNAHEVFSDRFIMDALLESIEEVAADDSKINSISINFGAPIGWSGTDDLERYLPEDLEQFSPNRKSSAMRVKPSCRDLPAPKTKWLTIIYELRHEKDQLAAIIHSVYPGQDIGALRGDITERESCVFFDWNHPGQ